ncbi:hypothetical protein P154DRAFT_308667 [Amniculicola lignicola CBS 123094]|uniref:Uncharacterized protein n=1 Tax=Amniculicola lignicola CBS 123094 TaxID=1392246 RepID=A0A6A5WG41_9PLEO|nr:hypothetical protein P154DRAFT_308667 [Amniculicola lignicola CBS 123094]
MSARSGDFSLEPLLTSPDVSRRARSNPSPCSNKEMSCQSFPKPGDICCRPRPHALSILPLPSSPSIHHISLHPHLSIPTPTTPSIPSKSHPHKTPLLQTLTRHPHHLPSRDSRIPHSLRTG